MRQYRGHLGTTQEFTELLGPSATLPLGEKGTADQSKLSSRTSSVYCEALGVMELSGRKNLKRGVVLRPTIRVTRTTPA